MLSKNAKNMIYLSYSHLKISLQVSSTSFCMTTQYVYQMSCKLKTIFPFTEECRKHYETYISFRLKRFVPKWIDFHD